MNVLISNLPVLESNLISGSGDLTFFAREDQDNFSVEVTGLSGVIEQDVRDSQEITNQFQKQFLLSIT